MIGILGSKDFLAGVFFVLLGCSAIFFGRQLEVGSAAQMGAGYFPMLIAGGLILLGLASVAKSLRAAGNEAAAAFFVRPAFFVVAAIVAFALTVRSTGFLVSCALMLALASFACVETRWREAVAVSIVLIAASVVIFIWGLSLPIPVLPT